MTSLSAARPGLDPAMLRPRLAATQARWTRARQMIADHIAAGHRPLVSWSGGKDSTVVCHLAASVDPDIPMVLFDSGLEYPETLGYVAEMSERFGWRLHIEPAVPDALSLMVRNGSWDHEAERDPTLDVRFHDALMTWPSRRARERFGCDTVLWGLRKDESAARSIALRTSKGVREHSGGYWTVAPVWPWPAEDIWAYHSAHGIPSNPIYDRLREMGAPERSLRVGMAISANALGYGRNVWLRRGWPEMWHRLCEALPRLRQIDED